MLRRSIMRAGKPIVKYTFTDEAPALATFALLPVMRRFCEPVGVQIDLSDISVASRILAQFNLDKDNLGELGALAKTPEGFIVKLPNVSASIPQLVEAIAELKAKGFHIPDFPADPKTAEEKEVREKYNKVLGSAVNPVLREGNSDRRAAAPVKAYAQKTRLPVKVQPWSAGSKSHVSCMSKGDFYGSEKSYVTPEATSVRIELVQADGTVKVLKEDTKLLAGEVIDASFMSVRELRDFFEREFEDAKAKDVIVSLHLKATMMKVSDPIMFGHAVSVFYKNAFEKNADALKRCGANPNNGLGSVLEAIKTLPEAEAKAIAADIQACYDVRPRVAMVDSSKGITNFHVPSDVIIDASMPPMVRDGGKMWNKDDALEDTKALIPDRCYATIYQTVVEGCKKDGQFDHTTMGHVSNVGLMAQKAEEYGSHDKTFEAPANGTVRVVDKKDGKTVIFEHAVEQGDIWRMCQTKDIPIQDWVKLAYTRAIASSTPAIFWLDENRAHDKNIMELIKKYGAQYEADAKAKGCEISVMPPAEACRVSVERARQGKDTISVTGNVLRDYNTDLFPIIELGTSAKMLSIVPLLAGGGMYETGAGGSAPKHVQQFVKEGHLRWDSLGEYLAMGACLEDMGKKIGDKTIVQTGAALNEAVGQVLDNDKSPMRKVKEADNRATTFYIAMYWAQIMAKNDVGSGSGKYTDLAKELAANEKQIVQDMLECQGPQADVGGYWKHDDGKVNKAMRPSETFNHILDKC